MKTQTQDSETFVPRAQGCTVTGEVKMEITFLWAEADEWKPAGEACEIMEETKYPHSSVSKNINH
jgi:hypothetical protein